MTGSKEAQNHQESETESSYDLVQQNLERLKFEVGQEMGINSKQKNKKY